ncbi:hypothetical protein [Methylocucumis oryzae]|uniref:hypothetical protein n=1 Tax=Methylocucumis oryzae TaxID=1632867 RepID=UPI000697C8E3|nr:hypothetical protein [Methylocucumis oryzae]
MCYCDDDAIQPTLYREVWRKAIKEHKCCECQDVIKIGERYQYVAGVWEGQFSTFKTCASCVDVRLEVNDMTGYFPAFGDAGCCYIEALHELPN